MFINFSTLTDPGLETCQIEELIKKTCNIAATETGLTNSLSNVLEGSHGCKIIELSNLCHVIQLYGNDIAFMLQCSTSDGLLARQIKSSIKEYK
jgi:hypothetical protein